MHLKENKLLRTIPDITGKLFDLYMTPFTFNLKRDKKLSNLVKGKNSIRGIVPEEFIPILGGTFKMYHHIISEKARFGSIKILDINKVIKENETYYFESNLSENKYILIPAQTN